MTDFFGVKILIPPWVVLPLLLLATVILAYLVSSVTLWVLRRSMPELVKESDSRFYRLLRSYFFPFLIVGVLLIVLDAVPLPPKILRVADRVLALSGLVLLIFVLGKAALQILRNIGARYEAMGNIQGPVEALIKIVFIAVGGMIILDNLGITLTPIITTLGIGSLAVAIALQDTLGNFFAGLYLKADRPIEMGHYVRLESGQEGFVDRIGWRSAHIRTLQNNIVVVPNNKLAQTIITNFDLPEERMAVLIPVGVSYDSDPQGVEEILLDEVKKAVGEVEGLLGYPEPFVRFIPGFGDFAMNFTLTCYVRRFADQFLVQHEMRKRIFKRFKEDGIQIPFHRAYVRPESN
ncbi:MAG: mechanosensitive ion channel family protein [Deltaproteobacteria bacterium]|nr:mechanosensitive ion channel family protein [Deltaproteobacteria bacterium]